MFHPHVSPSSLNGVPGVAGLGSQQSNGYLAVVAGAGGVVTIRGVDGAALDGRLDVIATNGIAAPE